MEGDPRKDSFKPLAFLISELLCAGLQNFNNRKFVPLRL